MGLFDGTPLQRPVTCPRCEKPLGDCRCPRDAAGAIRLPADQPVRVRRETGGRGGKTVTVILGLDPHATDLAALLKDLKNALGTGGTIKDAPTGTQSPGRSAPKQPTPPGRTLELQGDHRDRAVEILRQRGYPTKPAGG